MSRAYCLFDNLEVLDAEKLEDYTTRAAPVVERFGGRYLVIGGKAQVVEGDWAPVFPVMIQFPSLARAFEWYESEEYRDLKHLRHEAVRCNAVFIESI